MSSVVDIANELVDLCRAGRFLEALKLYADDAVSVEATAQPGYPDRVDGIEAIREKTLRWGKEHEVHEVQIKGPFVGGFQFAVYFNFDTTHKATGKRGNLREMALYDVTDDKISHEEFFYHQPE